MSYGKIEQRCEDVARRLEASGANADAYDVRVLVARLARQGKQIENQAATISILRYDVIRWRDAFEGTGEVERWKRCDSR